MKPVTDTHYVLAKDLIPILRLYILDHETKYPLYANVDAPTTSGKQYIMERVVGVSETMYGAIMNGRKEKVPLKVADALLCAIDKPEVLHDLTVYEEK